MSNSAKSIDPNLEGNITCPYCGDNVPVLRTVEAGMMLRLKQAQVDNVPDSVCDGCNKMFTRMISKGAVLRHEQKAREHNRLMLWRNRVHLIKQAKAHLQRKSYSDAAVAFEKYLRVLEIVYDVKAGELAPSHFKNEARSQEMTVITSVYWDLMRIYDTHSQYNERQLKAAAKLSEFVRFTPIFPHIMRKAEAQMRTARNPEAFRRFIKLSNSRRPRCFIATAAFNGYESETVSALCRFRDRHLKASRGGRSLVTLYYRVSPRIASWLDRHPALKPATRTVLTWLAESKFVRKRLNT